MVTVNDTVRFRVRIRNEGQCLHVVWFGTGKYADMPNHGQVNSRTGQLTD